MSGIFVASHLSSALFPMLGTHARNASRKIVHRSNTRMHNSCIAATKSSTDTKSPRSARKRCAKKNCLQMACRCIQQMIDNSMSLGHESLLQLQPSKLCSVRTYATRLYSIACVLHHKSRTSLHDGGRPGQTRSLLLLWTVRPCLETRCLRCSTYDRPNGHSWYDHPSMRIASLAN